MAIREVKKKSPPPVMRCVSCGATQIKISVLDWMPWGSAFVCGKKACRQSVGAPVFVPSDERKLV
jgi:hypothetical protein